MYSSNMGPQSSPVLQLHTLQETCIERQRLVSMLERRQLCPGAEIPLLGKCQRCHEIVNLEQVRQRIAEDRRDRKKPTT